MHLVTQRPAWIPLGTTANKQGRVAGDNAAGAGGAGAGGSGAGDSGGGRGTGGRARFAGIVGTMVTRICGVECARTGLSEREASAAGFRAVQVGIDHINHAAYLGGERLFIKLLGERGVRDACSARKSPAGAEGGKAHRRNRHRAAARA